MTERQDILLKNLVENHIKTADAVASAYLSEKLNVSSATVRNEMVALEESGMIYQPHTSAGRIPTIKGYEHYLEHHFDPKDPAKEIQEMLKRSRDDYKEFAKMVAQISSQAVMIALDKYNYFYTGFSQLAEKPEFAEQHEIKNLAYIVDELDTALGELYDGQDGNTHILIGDENPFSQNFSFIVTSVRLKGEQPSVFGLLGPVRMDYNKLFGLTDFIKNQILK